MLAKAAAAPPPITYKFGDFNIQNRSFSNGNGNRSLKLKTKSRKRAVVVVRAGYSQRPLETPGAYELIDDTTGEKFIIWGGIDGKDNGNRQFSIPSEEVLSWKPKPSSNYDNRSRNVTTSSISGEDEFKFNSNKNNRAATNRSGDKTAYGRGVSGSFGRLKAQKVRDHVRKKYVMKQEVSRNDYIEQDAPSHGSMSSDYESDVVDELKGPYVYRRRNNVSRAIQSQKFMTRDNVVPLESNGKHGVQQMPTNQSTTSKSQESDLRIAGRPGPNVSVSRVSASSFTKWGNGELIHKFGSEAREISNKWRKSNADIDFFSRKSFRDLGCSDYMIEALKSHHFQRPSHIQAMAFASVTGGKSCIIADQSGSGKTLAYLLPVIQRLRQEELQGLGKSVSQSPRVIVLVPTAELASQVLSICRSLSKVGVPFRSMVATGGFRQRTQLENLRQDLDVLITTPGRFVYLLKEGFLQLTNLRCAVLDEVDILFNDEDFDPALQSLINSSPFTTQFLFVTATLPVDIYNKLVEVFPDCEVIMGPGMHRTSPGLEEILVDCSGPEGTEKNPDTAFSNKKSALLQLVEETTVAKTIVFCNKIETCRKVENALNRYDKKGIHMRVLPFHAALAQESRLANMEEFRSSQLKDSSLFLVCTDRVSRGIDFAGVDRVVLFDFPRDPSEYVRRVGRTARGAGGKGEAFIFVVGKQVSLARRIIERNKKGHPLHDVPSAYENSRM
ncbi:unnamed protein product [Ilex paraguariensis]|uniref:DEAD-box ATP-dependent RNA helicase 50 n=1 Tax=Ilex paraguariensis TaxID=185542 RepID=A0ABC8R7I6_9AQUA